MGSNQWDGEPYHKPPDDPPKVIYHRKFNPNEPIPEEYRRVFGSPPPKEAKRPVPPPPPPPNSYHKKPKYWQSRYTGHNQIPNRMAGVMCVGICGVIYLIGKYSEAPQRWGKRLGYSMTLEEKIEYDKKNEFYFHMMVHGAPVEQYATNLSGDKYINIRRADDKIRWDLREVDRNIVGTRNMANPDLIF